MKKIMRYKINDYMNILNIIVLLGVIAGFFVEIHTNDAVQAERLNSFSERIEYNAKLQDEHNNYMKVQLDDLKCSFKELQKEVEK